MKKALLLLITLTVIISSCKDDEPDTPFNLFSLTSPPTFIGVIDSVPIAMQGDFEEVYWFEDIDSTAGSSIVFASSLHMSEVTYEPLITIKIGNLFYPNNDLANSTLFHDYFTTGANPYTYGWVSNTSQTHKWVEIEYLDDMANTWGTAFWSGDQTGSTFEVVELVKGLKPNGAVVRVKGKLNCKLYDLDGNEKQLVLDNFECRFETYEP